MEQLSQTESLYSSKGRTYEAYIFSRDFLRTVNKSPHKIEPCPCFGASAIDEFCPKPVIRDNKIYVFMVCGFICIDLREKIIDSVWLALNGPRREKTCLLGFRQSET